MFNAGNSKDKTLEDYMPSVCTCTESPLHGMYILTKQGLVLSGQLKLAEILTFNIFVFYSGQAFCEQHSLLVKKAGYKTGLRDFLTQCSNGHIEVIPNKYSKEMKTRVDTVLDEISGACNSTLSNSATDAQGIYSVLLCNLCFNLCCMKVMVTFRILKASLF